MVLNGAYVIARNAWGRPTLEHKVNLRDSNRTGCGYDISAWSRYYTSVRIEVLLCKQPGCRS